MAKSVVSGFAAKLGKAGLEAFNEHKDDEIQVGGGGDCPVIPLGVAQLVDIHMGEHQEGDNKGKPFVYLGGIVVSPKFAKDADGAKLPAAGCRTSNTEPLYDTPKRKRATLKDHMAWFLNELKKLGLDTTGMDMKNLDAAVAALVQSKPYFRFNTSQSEPSPQYPNPMMFHNWNGVIVDYEDDTDPDAGVVEETTEEAPAATKKTATSTKPTGTASSKKGMKKVEPEEEDVPFGDDLDMAADQADKDVAAGREDTKALVYMGEKAKEAGLTEEEIEGTETWQEVAQLIRDKESGEDESEEETEAVDYDALGEQADAEDADAIEAIKTWSSEYGEDPDEHGDKTWTEFVTYIKETYEAETQEEPEELVPEKGSVYEATVGKNKKPSQVEVLVVKTKEKTVNVKDLGDNKVYPSVAWSALSEVS